MRTSKNNQFTASSTKSRYYGGRVTRLILISLSVLTLVTLGAGSRLFNHPIWRVGAAQQSAQGDDGSISESALNQIRALSAEKLSRTPVQRKIDSELLAALKMSRGEAVAEGIPTIETGVQADEQGKVVVDIYATVTDGLLEQVARIGGTITENFPQDHFLRAHLPLAQLELVASLEEVRFISRPSEAKYSATSSRNTGNPRLNPSVLALASLLKAKASGSKPVAPYTGSVTSQGDKTHRADTGRSSFSVNGAGVKIGVLSNNFNSLGGAAADIASGNLPGPGNPNGFTTPVTVLQESFLSSPSPDEGRAMLQIIHDLAPGAQLYFATANNMPSNFAQNIRNLRSAGCDIIVDDVIYLNESPFQDGVVAQAVTDVTASGALYFSSAGNGGNLDDNTSSVWQGDFNDSGFDLLVNGQSVGTIHSFGSANYNQVSSSEPLDLFWSDPLAGSSNDYDVYILNSTGTSVLRKSTNFQTGTQDPYESISTDQGGVNANERIVVVKYQGNSRFLHLNTNGAKLTIATSGQTRGHACAVNAFGVAAVRAATSYPNPFVGGATNPVETFSSDGPRRVFYNADGTAITPGNFSSTGGAVRQKPDIAAADGVTTSMQGFNPFYGTSAAAPHAAAIAALLKAKRPSITPAEVRAALTSTALDIEGTGVDRDSGYGIVMAFQALEAITYVGYIDSVDCSRIIGWAANRDHLNTPVTVNIFDVHGSITDIYTATANLSRPDVGAYLGDNGLHGFNFTFPSPLAAGSHRISVKVDPASTYIGNSPQTFSCSGSSQPDYIGFFDAGDCNVIRGWAADRNRPNTSINVGIYDGSTLLMTVLANQLRSDVGGFLGDNGLHGFNITTPASLKNGQSHTVHVKFESSSTELINSPRTIACAAAADYVGFFDAGDCNVIRGWAADRNRPNTSINVSIYDGSTLLTTVLANQLRSDVGAYLGDNGLHGFNITTPSSLKDGQTHTVRVKFETSSTDLINSPKTITCATTTDYIGFFDAGDCNVIRGWAADRNRPNTSINVGIYDGSTLLMTVLANQLRSDVGGFLGDNGLHGFNITTPASLKNGQSHTVHVKFESSSTELINSPRTIACGGALPQINTISPPNPPRRDVNQNIIVNGSNFQQGLTVTVFIPGGGTSTLSGSQIQSVTGSSFTMVVTLNVLGQYGIRVNNPDGGQSNTFSFSTQQPQINSISPASPVASGSSQNVSVFGSGFQSGLTVSITFPGGGGTTLSGSQIQSVSSSSFVMVVTLNGAGTWSIRVNNPDGGQSNTFNFTVQPPISSPTISSISPTVPTASGSNQNVSVFGSSFQSGLSVSVTFPGGGGTTLSGSQIQSVTSTSFVMVVTLNGAGTWSIRVNNPDGGQSNTFSFTVRSSPAISSISPASPVASGSSQNVSVFGSGFQSGLTVSITFPGGGGTTLSGSQIQSVSSSSFVMVVTLNGAGTWSIRVNNPDGGQSNTFNFTVRAALAAQRRGLVSVGVRRPVYRRRSESSQAHFLSVVSREGLQSRKVYAPQGFLLR